MAKDAEVNNEIELSMGSINRIEKNVKYTKGMAVAAFIVAIPSLVICGISCYLVLKK